MKIFLKSFTFIICFICVNIIGTPAYAKESKSVSMLFFNVAPHVFIDKTGEITGAVYEFINDHIAPEMGVEFFWSKTKSLANVPRQIVTLETKPRFAAALLVYSPKRAKVVDFTNTAYFMSQPVIMLAEANPLNEISNIEDILHLKIGYAKKTFITPFMKDKRVQFDLIGHPDWNKANIQKLLNGRVDAVYAPDKAGLLYTAKELNAVKKVRAVNLPEKAAPFHIVFSKGSKELVRKYNLAFEKLNGQALYLKLLRKYLDTSLL